MIYKQQLKKFYYGAMKALRRDAAMLKEIRRNNHLVILNLHSVTPNFNPFYESMSPEIFEDLLMFLKQNFQVILFNQLESLEKSKANLTPVIISFDDGYYDFIEYAMPVLHKYKLRANMNIIPRCIESSEPIWNVKLCDFLNAAPKKMIDEFRFHGFDYRLKDESKQSKMEYGLKICNFLKNRPRRERQELWRDIGRAMEKINFPLTRVMNLQEVKEISNEHEIGVHSYSHESMGYEENEFFKDDLEKCSRYFTESLQMPLNIYAFPNGSYRPEQIEILKEKSVKHILLVDECYAQINQSIYPRFTVYGLSKLETRFVSLGINNKGN